jgi:hypothetical protein
VQTGVIVQRSRWRRAHTGSEAYLDLPLPHPAHKLPVKCCSQVTGGNCIGNASRIPNATGSTDASISFSIITRSGSTKTTKAEPVGALTDGRCHETWGDTDVAVRPASHGAADDCRTPASRLPPSSPRPRWSPDRERPLSSRSVPAPEGSADGAGTALVPAGPRPNWPSSQLGRVIAVPPARFELTHPAPEAGALSPELRGRASSAYAEASRLPP